MPIADAWYDHPAWGFVGVVVAVVVGGAGIWAAFRAATPKMRLRYHLKMVTPLMAARSLDSNSLSVTLDGEKLADPYIAIIVLGFDGRQDIPEDAFSKGRPLELDLGFPVLSVLETAYDPEDAPIPVLAAAGTRLQVGPDLLHRGSTLSVAVLVDGGKPTLRSPERTLVDVRMEPGKPVQPMSWMGSLVFFLITGWIVATQIGTAWGWYPTVRTTSLGIYAGLAIWAVLALVKTLRTKRLLPRLASWYRQRPTA
jgi:hypothetical protein